MEIQVKWGDQKLKVRSLEWVRGVGWQAKGEQHETSLREEVLAVFWKTWLGVLDPEAFGGTNNATQLYECVIDNIAYTIESYWLGGRYDNPVDMSLVAGSAIDYTYSYLKMEYYYNHEDEKKNIR